LIYFGLFAVEDLQNCKHYPATVGNQQKKKLIFVNSLGLSNKFPPHQISQHSATSHINQEDNAKNILICFLCILFKEN